MLRNLLGVRPLNKPAGREEGELFVKPESAFNVGVIEFIGEDLRDGKYTQGQKVYIGNQREQIRIDGMDIMVMKEDNVYATVEEG
jgi:hypothetical protein